MPAMAAAMAGISSFESFRVFNSFTADLDFV